MATLQVKNLPDELYADLREMAKARNITISAAVRSAIERDVSNAKWWDRWDKLPDRDINLDAVDLLREAREMRDAELE